jgi:NADH-quinone oxidoreductase subunit F
VDDAVARIGREPDKAIPLLQAVQEHYRYLPQAARRRLCEITEITPAQIEGVATFYTQFRFRPAGRHRIRLCVGTACHVKGSQAVDEALRRHLKIPEGADTDPEGLFTIDRVACLGCCTLAPVVQIDDVTYGHMAPDLAPRMLRDFLEQGRAEGAPGRRRRRAARGRSRGELRIGLGSCCVARGSRRVQQALEEAVADTGVSVSVKRVGCVGMCHQTPLVEVVPAGGRSFLYARVHPEDARAIVTRHFKAETLGQRAANAVSGWVDRILTDEVWQPLTRYSIDVRDAPVAAFLTKQKRITTEHSGTLDPTDLDEYLARDGFRALERVLSKGMPEQTIEEIHCSGLKGRGGAGYLTGLKWRQVRAAAGEKKYVICNGDEGDPGAFMDRMLLESYPYRVIEGMAIAAYVVGAHDGIFYIRAEYPLALRRVREALLRCEERGIVGSRVLGRDFGFRIRIFEGAGAFVCGEETGLIASLEGRRGMPRLRPPYPAVHGFNGQPTLVNNVETYAAVPWIIRNGPEAFADVGTPDSRGTKVFALAGKVARVGLIEVPTGITIREIVEEIGGGIAEGRRFKAVQIGGPSGGCIPAELADIPVDYHSLAEAGAMMGSGGFVVLDETDCMVEMARYFLAFTQDQSCGKCTFCRVGTRRLLEMLERICAGEGKPGDLEEIERLARMVKAGSLCGLGKTAPNPVLTTLRYFREEYEAHLQKRCPAGKCRALVRYRITDECIGCTLCAQHCPVNAIPMKPYERHEIDQTKCTRCDTCRRICPAKAVTVQ